MQGDKTRIDKICSNDELKTWDISSFEFLVDICWHVLDSESEKFRADTGLSYVEILEFCDTDDTLGFGEWLNYTETTLYQHYNCSFKSKDSLEVKRCTKHEIALKQWARSEITYNPPAELSQKYSNKSFTGRDWFPEEELFAKPYEIMFFIKKFPLLFNDSVTPFEGFTDE